MKDKEREKSLPMLFVDQGDDSKLAKQCLEEAGIEAEIIKYERTPEGKPPVLLDRGARYDGLRFIKIFVEQYKKLNGLIYPE